MRRTGTDGECMNMGCLVPIASLPPPSQAPCTSHFSSPCHSILAKSHLSKVLTTTASVTQRGTPNPLGNTHTVTLPPPNTQRSSLIQPHTVIITHPMTVRHSHQHTVSRKEAHIQKVSESHQVSPRLSLPSEYTEPKKDADSHNYKYTHLVSHTHMYIHIHSHKVSTQKQSNT